MLNFSSKEKGCIIIFFSWTKGQESFFYDLRDTIEIETRETSQTRGGKHELCDF